MMDGSPTERGAEAAAERRGAWTRSAGLAVPALVADVEERVERVKREVVATRRPRMGRCRGA